jgi:hypothetical protein
MIEFANDAAVQAEVTEHAAVFEFYRSVLEYCQGPLETGVPLSVVRGDGVDDAVVWVSMTQYVKLWRLGTAAARLAQSGHAYEAESLVRSMYEVALLLEFVLRRQVQPKENGKKLAHGQRPFSSSFRAKMYVAHTAFRRLKWAEAAAATRGLKRQVPPSLRKRLDSEARPLQATVGPFWAKRLRDSPTGLSIRALSETLGVKKLYDSLYRARSTSVHPGDIERFVWESGGRLSLRLAPQSSLPQTLGESMALLLRGAFWIAKRLQVLEMEECKSLRARVDDVCGSTVPGSGHVGD